MNGPDFLCIGAQKAATTWLSRNLSLHPKVWPAFVKEIHFFDAVENDAQRFWSGYLAKRLEKRIERAKRNREPRRRIAYLESVRPTLTRPLDEAWYAGIFAAKPRGAIAGDFTPRYATLSETSIDRVRKLLPGVKTIYLIRDPVDRAMSNFRMQAGREVNKLEDPQALDAFARRWVEARGYDSSEFATFIPRWDARIDPSRMLYLPFGAVKQDPGALLAQVERFLGLKPFTGYALSGRPINRTKPTPAPDWLRDHLEADLAPHRAFLEQRFPADFVSLLR